MGTLSEAYLASRGNIVISHTCRAPHRPGWGERRISRFVQHGEWARNSTAASPKMPCGLRQEYTLLYIS